MDSGHHTAMSWGDLCRHRYYPAYKVTNVPRIALFTTYDNLLRMLYILVIWLVSVFSVTIQRIMYVWYVWSRSKTTQIFLICNLLGKYNICRSQAAGNSAPEIQNTLNEPANAG